MDGATTLAFPAAPAAGAARDWMTVGPGDEERALISAAQQGSAPAVEAIVRRQWPIAHRVAFLIVQDAAAAEDIAQDSLLAAVDALDRSDNGRPLAPWLHRIVVNNSLKWLRAAPRRREVGTESPPETASAVRARDVSDELLAALAALDVEQRAVVVLRYLLEYTPGEIADALEMPRGTVNSRLRRALDRLGETLGKDFE